MNRPMIAFDCCGMVPVNSEPYAFETAPPKRIGDEAVIVSSGRRVHVQLRRSSGMARNALYLVAIKHLSKPYRKAKKEAHA